MKEILFEIIKELEKYNKSSKIVDANFINKVIDLFVNRYSINHMVKNFSSDLIMDKSYMSGYNIEDKKINIGLDIEVETAKRRLASDGVIFNLYDKVKFINLEILGAVIHELTHALQYDKCLKNLPGIETELLKMSFEKNLMILCNGYNSDNYTEKQLTYISLLDEICSDEIMYLSQPCERMANITGNEYESMICEELVKTTSTDLKRYIDIKNIVHKRLGYTGGNCPSAFYKSIIETLRKQSGLMHGETDININSVYYSAIAKREGMILEEKLYYGFPISFDENEKLDCEEKELKRKLF